MTRFPRPLLALLPLGLIALVALLIVPRCGPHGDTSAPAAGPGSAPEASISPPPAPVWMPERAALHPVEPSAAHPRSPLADTLNSPASTADDDLRAIGRMLGLYRERFGAYPAFGDNAQLVNALAGANPHRLPLLPRDVPAVSAATGELLDRWGTPYVFHALSRDAIEVRSAGPDRAPYTSDDLIAPLGKAAAPSR